MSRCFPYPPPGHTLSKASNEALIESIKLQRLKEEAKEQRKKEKREKKDKRKEKKEKKKEKKEKKKVETNQNLDKSHSAKVNISKSVWTDTEFEQLERSSLTEENGQPVCLRSSSSDSTENSNKRKRHSSSLDGNRSHSKIILVLPSKKLNDSDPSLKEQHPNSTFARVEKTRNKDLSSLRDKPENNINQSLTLKIGREGICSTSGRTEDLLPVKIQKTGSSRIQRLHSQYQDLIVNWVPPQLEEPPSLYSEDLDWLCTSNNQDTRDVKKAKLENDSNVMSSCSGSAGLWPRAQYLSDDIYALPYTVPF